jgi:adhesin HecA-like repeat protein
MGARRRHLYSLVLAAVLAGVAVTGCRGGQASVAAIIVDRPVALVDEPVQLKVLGLTAGSAVTVTAQTVDLPVGQLRARATYRADAHGSVDLARTAPTSGTYDGADGMGLFWSMYQLPAPVTPQPSPPQASAGFTAGPGYHVRLTATVAGHQVATATLTRRWYQPGVEARPLTLRADGVVGVLYRPPAGTPQHPAVLIFGGSEGGNTQRSVAALLASHGYPR